MDDDEEQYDDDGSESESYMASCMRVKSITEDTQTGMDGHGRSHNGGNIGVMTSSSRENNTCVGDRDRYID